MDEFQTIIEEIFCPNCHQKNKVTLPDPRGKFSYGDISIYWCANCRKAIGRGSFASISIEIVEPTEEEKQAIENAEKLKRDTEEENAKKMHSYKGWRRLHVRSRYAVWRQEGIDTEYEREINRVEIEAVRRFSLRCCQVDMDVSVTNVTDEALTITWKCKTYVITNGSGVSIHIDSCAPDCHGWIDLSMKM